MKDIAKFIAGFERFQEKYFGEERELFEQLQLGQSPKALIVACADSRVDPAMFLSCATSPTWCHPIIPAVTSRVCRRRWSSPSCR